MSERPCNPFGRHGAAVRIEGDAPPGIRWRLYPTLADLVLDLQSMVSDGLLERETVFVITVAPGTKHAHRRWVWISERGCVAVSRRGGEMRNAITAAGVLARWHGRKEAR